MTTLITQDRLNELIRLAGTTPPGIFAEVGVYKGGSLKVLADSFPERLILGFDTFTGLPAKYWSEEEVHKPNDFNDTSIEAVKEYVNNTNVQLFKCSFPLQIFNKFKFSFVHLDVDFYESTKVWLDFFIKRMHKGGVIVLDDYGWPNCPGIEKALKDIEHHKTNAQYQAYIQL
jgi:predicted O-methyltransferase YrrM